MDRTFESGAAGSPPSAPASPSSGYPTAGNPQTATPATKPGPWWYHMMTEELRAVIVAAGLTPDHTDVTQLSQAIQALFIANQKAVVINGATFEASVSNGEVVRWDSGNNRFDEAVADGSSNNRAVGVADVTNSKVYLYGECALFSGLTPGARYYLDASTPGAITATAPADAVMVGIAKSATVLWVDVDALGGRTRLTGNLTLYVATTGNDSNTGLSAGSPFLTIQKAVDTIYEKYDLAGNVATIQLADGTYTAGASLNGVPVGYRTGNSPIILQGNAGTPSNTVISVTGNNCIYASMGALLQIQNIKLQTTTSGNCLYASYRAAIHGYAGIIFGACAGSHCVALVAGSISLNSSYTIAGGAVRHWNAAQKGIIYASSITITLSGTPAFTYFADFSDIALALVSSNTFSGAATGTRYVLTTNSVINTNGGGANYLPGNVAGSAASGGQYV